MNAVSIIKIGLLLTGVVSVFFPVAVIASPGAANATIACKSVSTKGGVIHLSGNIPGDLAEFELSLKRNTAETKMSSRANEDILVVDDFANKVFTMAVYGKAGRLILYAIPGTIVASGDREHDFKARFTAILSEAPSPADARKVKMTC